MRARRERGRVSQEKNGFLENKGRNPAGSESAVGSLSNTILPAFRRIPYIRLNVLFITNEAYILRK